MMSAQLTKGKFRAVSPSESGITGRVSSYEEPRSTPARGLRTAPDGRDEQDGNRGREQPPRVRVVRGEQLRQREGDGDARGDTPVVPDDEVPPEASEAADVVHAAPSDGRSACSRRQRSTRASVSESTATNAITPSTAASEPGQSTPAPSAPQKVPKPVSSTPTVNFRAFSGTRASGPRTAIPTATTSTTAAAAAAA